MSSDTEDLDLVDRFNFISAVKKTNIKQPIELLKTTSLSSLFTPIFHLQRFVIRTLVHMECFSKLNGPKLDTADFKNAFDFVFLFIGSILNLEFNLPKLYELEHYKEKQRADLETSKSNLCLFN
ncbi:hypothetical protein ACTXT7_007803 [Hymenolepis weldensis]